MYATLLGKTKDDGRLFETEMLAGVIEIDDCQISIITITNQNRGRLNRMEIWVVFFIEFSNDSLIFLVNPWGNDIIVVVPRPLL